MATVTPTTLSRRAVLAGLVLPAVPRGSSPLLDADLLRMALDLDRLERERAKAEVTATDEDYEKVVEALGDLVERMVGMKAHSLEGVIAKARAARWCRSDDLIDADSCTDEKLAFSIVADLLSMGRTA